MMDGGLNAKRQSPCPKSCIKNNNDLLIEQEAEVGVKHPKALGTREERQSQGSGRCHLRKVRDDTGQVWGGLEAMPTQQHQRWGDRLSGEGSRGPWAGAGETGRVGVSDR